MKLLSGFGQNAQGFKDLRGDTVNFQECFYLFTLGLFSGFVLAFIPYFISFVIGHFLKLMATIDLEDD